MTAKQEYASCEWLEGGLAFNRRSLHACLIVHHRTGLPFFADYAGGELPLEKVLTLREEMRAARRRGIVQSECAGCPHLTTRAWPVPRHAIEIVGIAHYSACNIECNYCFLQTQDPASFADGYRPYPLVPVFERLIREGHLAPGAIIDWGGGEPTIYREFDALLEMMLAHGTFHYIHTNGTRLPPPLRHGAPAERVHVICSVDAGLPETYFRIKKRDFLERVWSNLEEYVRLGVKVSLKYIVTGDNCGDADLEAFVERARRVGAHELIVDMDYDHPSPDEKIVRALGRLKGLLQAAGLPARFGFTGANFAPEHAVGPRVEAAFQAEQQQLGRLSLPMAADQAGRGCSTEPKRWLPALPRTYKVAWLNHNLPETWPENGLYEARVRLQNTGRRTWSAHHPEGRSVQMTIFVDQALQQTAELPHDVARGQEVEIAFRLVLPAGAALGWDVKLALVEQNVAWFEEHGAEPLAVRVCKTPFLARAAA